VALDYWRRCAVYIAALKSVKKIIPNMEGAKGGVEVDPIS
jgi:hypothetical protein